MCQLRQRCGANSARPGRGVVVAKQPGARLHGIALQAASLRFAAAGRIENEYLGADAYGAGAIRSTDGKEKKKSYDAASERAASVRHSQYYGAGEKCVPS